MTADGFFDPRLPFSIRWGDLPHWRQEGAIYFVTFRLSDSIPRSTVERWKAEMIEWRRCHPDASQEEVEDYTLAHRRRIEKWLDKGLGSCVLGIPEAGRIVEAAISHFEGTRYNVLSATVALNHVHTLIRPFDSVDLSDVLYSWKRFTSTRLRRLPSVQARWTGPTRHLWQTESFDHIVRNQSSLERFDQYIRNHT